MASSKYRGFNVGAFMDPGSMIFHISDAVTRFNANLFRMQISDPSHTIVNAPIPDYLNWIESLFPNIDAAVSAAKSKDIKLILGLFALPKGSFYTLLGKKRDYVFYDNAAEQAFYEAWRMIADRYKSTSEIIGYDLVNEPAVRRYRHLAPVLVAAGSIIRQYDSQKKLIYSAPFGSIDKIKGYKNYMNEIKTLGKPWFTVHMYYPHNVTHQGLPDASCNISKPIGSALYPTSKVNKEKLRNKLQDVREFQRDHKVRIFIGEFSCIRWSGFPTSDNRVTYLRDCMQIFEEYNWRYTYHAFAEANMWELEHPWLPCPDPCQPHCSADKIWTDSAEMVKTYFSRNK